MGQIGVGAMLHYLSGGSPHAAEEYAGRKIVEAAIEDDALRLKFEDGSAIKIYDDGQSCCESRYLTTDDDVKTLEGHTLVSISAKDGPSEEGECGDCHETCFVEVQSSGGFVTLTNHNEHNGYYGGFGLSISELSPAMPSVSP